MKIYYFLLASQILFFLFTSCTNKQATETEYFEQPNRGFISNSWVENIDEYHHGILTGNGTVGAIVLGRPYDDILFLSHASLYLPYKTNNNFIDVASNLKHIQNLCLKGKYEEAGQFIKTARDAAGYHDKRDPYIGAFSVSVIQPESNIKKYQRSVDFSTGRAMVSVEDERGVFRRTTFASRKDEIIVLRLSGMGKQTAELSFNALEARDEREEIMKEEGVKFSEQGVKDDFLYFRTLFANQNPYNPNIGFEGIGRIVTKGGTTTKTDSSIIISDAKEILLLVKIEPLLKGVGVESNYDLLKDQINAVEPNYSALLKSHAEIHSDLMDRVSLSLEAPDGDRTLPNETLIKKFRNSQGSLAFTERAFDAGRYNIISSTGFHPPNLLGLWSATWFAKWSGSFTTNGNLPCAISFNLMGNTPELMEPYFRYYDERWDGFRKNAKMFYGCRGFHVPAQLTVSPLLTNFSPGYPLHYSHAGAPWALQFYYDYYQYTGDKEFLKERAYPLMKEAAEFYEDFLTIKDDKGKFVFVPSYSPENYPNGGPPSSINATMDISAAKQLLRNLIKASQILNVDEDYRDTWSELINNLPDYEVDDEGYFREWLWPGLNNNNDHRHASLLYALYDEIPEDIINDTVLVKGIENYLDYNLDYKARATSMAFGAVQNGLAAAHIGHAKYAEYAIHILLFNYWANGMASLHDKDDVLNMDISGGFPYLCASALIYADPGNIKLLPAKPVSWEKGTLKGIRLRGSVVVEKLSWDHESVEAIIASDKDQILNVEFEDQLKSINLSKGISETIKF
jgi:hypothetical protein